MHPNVMLTHRWKPVKIWSTGQWKPNLQGGQTGATNQVGASSDDLTFLDAYLHIHISHISFTMQICHNIYVNESLYMSTETYSECVHIQAYCIHVHMRVCVYIYT